MLDLNRYSHSDDVLEVLYAKQHPLVRKVFRANISRVQLNVEKQRLFRTLHVGKVRLRAAEVVEFSVHKDRAELLMPYIQGITGHMFPSHATRNLAQNLSASLSTLLYHELNESCEQSVPTTLFRDKLVSVSHSTRDPDLRRLVDTCLDLVNTYPAEMSFPIGPCHGDLTLSNLILDPVTGITLIDFLYTFLESPIQDVAKLKQDFVYGWSFRMDSSAQRIKAEIFSRHHFPRAIIEIERIYPAQVYLLTLMTLARIAPYVKDEVTQQWLVRSLTNCIGDFHR